jgi:hypothetical protein
MNPAGTESVKQDLVEVQNDFALDQAIAKELCHSKLSHPQALLGLFAGQFW